MSNIERLLEDILEKKASPETLCLLLPKLSATGRQGLVIRHCHTALEAHPEHSGLRILLAEAYLNSGLAARASDQLERVTRSIDESARSYALLAKAYETQGRREEAARCLEIYLAHHPDDSDSRESLRRLRPPIMEKHRETLEASVAEEADFAPNEALPEIATPTLAELYFSQGQLDAAVETYEKHLSRSPNDSRAMMRLGELKAMAIAPQERPSEEKGTEHAPEENKEAPSVNAETLKSRKLIATLEDWLSRIQESRVNASAQGGEPFGV